MPELNKLPIPTLDETAYRYLETLKPLLNEEQLQKTKKKIYEWIANEGKILQDALLEHDKVNDSYIEEFWSDAYLKPGAHMVSQYLINYCTEMIFK